MERMPPIIGASARTFFDEQLCCDRQSCGGATVGNPVGPNSPAYPVLRDVGLAFMENGFIQSLYFTLLHFISFHFHTLISIKNQ
jgi:hypothetical protein